MQARYDAEAGAAYVTILSPEGRKVVTEKVAENVLLDWVRSPSGFYELAGIELLDPHPRPRLARIAARYDFAHLLDDIYAVLDTTLGVSVSGPMQLTGSMARL